MFHGLRETGHGSTIEDSVVGRNAETNLVNGFPLVALAISSVLGHLRGFSDCDDAKKTMAMVTLHLETGAQASSRNRMIPSFVGSPRTITHREPRIARGVVTRCRPPIPYISGGSDPPPTGSCHLVGGRQLTSVGIA